VASAAKAGVRWLVWAALIAAASRPGDERRALLPLLHDENPHVRLQAAKFAYPVSPAECRACLEAIRAAKLPDQSLDAGMTLRRLSHDPHYLDGPPPHYTNASSKYKAKRRFDLGPGRDGFLRNSATATPVFRLIPQTSGLRSPFAPAAHQVLESNYEMMWTVAEPCRTSMVVLLWPSP
jgi:hypothetical protein